MTLLMTAFFLTVGVAVAAISIAFLLLNDVFAERERR